MESYYERHREEILSKKRKWKNENPKLEWARCTLKNHKVNCKVCITTEELFEFIKEQDTCEICGCKLEWHSPKMCSISPTLDRIDNEDYITLDNIQLICHRCNRSKTDRTMKDFIEYCKMVADKYG